MFERSFSGMANLHIRTPKHMLMCKYEKDLNSQFPREYKLQKYQISITMNWTSSFTIPKYCVIMHYNDITMGSIASQITSLTIVYSAIIRAQIKENIKAPRHWPLRGEFTGEFPTKMACYAENFLFDDVILDNENVEFTTLAQMTDHCLMAPSEWVIKLIRAFFGQRTLRFM